MTEVMNGSIWLVASSELPLVPDPSWFRALTSFKAYLQQRSVLDYDLISPRYDIIRSLDNAKSSVAFFRLFTTKNINPTLVAFSWLQTANYTTPFGASRRLY
ncbi:unnamed protein product [Fusarium venenatum]|uniref:Uncharacterized protein n=1 Tax=Fusarium venenatum TaxID=56646 RepID=A0A2L2TL81_9HYPO|nr:uncharacterized protein FVRRES_09000 [Fusarium venenatum]CEI68923.1 unnamed protein product [Fusarium venenatum]